MSSATVTDDLRVLVETVEALQASERKLKSKLSVLEQQLVTKEAEIESLRMLPNENILIREENHQLRDKIRELEATATRAVELGSAGTESQTQLQVKLQAFQRHNHYLQGELAVKESKIRTTQEKLDIVSEELHQKDRRCSLLIEKLRQHSLDPNVSIHHATHIQVPEETFAQMKQKLSSQTSAMDLLQERVETLQEDNQRRELLVDALQRENAALRQSVSRLIAQVNGAAMHHVQQGNGANLLTMQSSSPGSNHNNSATERLKAFRSAKSAVSAAGDGRRGPSPPLDA